MGLPGESGSLWKMIKRTNPWWLYLVVALLAGAMVSLLLGIWRKAVGLFFRYCNQPLVQIPYNREMTSTCDLSGADDFKLALFADLISLHITRTLRILAGSCLVCHCQPNT